MENTPKFSFFWDREFESSSSEFDTEQKDFWNSVEESNEDQSFGDTFSHIKTYTCA